MSFAKKVYKKLSSIDITPRINTIEFTNGPDLTYLSWAWAWELLMQHYPESTWEVLPDVVLEDKTVEVRCRVTVKKKDKSHSRIMWLPVMGKRHEAVVSPTTRQISDARMRAMVKCLALFGLGLWLYRKEDLPLPMTIEEATRAHKLSITVIQAELTKYIDNEDENALYAAAEEYWNLPIDVRDALWVAPTTIVDGKRENNPDAVWTTKMRDTIKTTEFRKIYYGETTHG
jgi:hypothetical protein|tara:strand:- start:333 stop:1022 length:690 start_codon:yes stop_codon:yes gene_type:complete